MSQSLCFNDFIFSPITRDNQPWFKSSEIARALGYKREDKVTQIYQRNADEFTEGMTQLVEISAEPQNEVLGNFRDWSRPHLLTSRLPPPRNVRPDSGSKGIPQVGAGRHRAVRRQGARCRTCDASTTS